MAFEVVPTPIRRRPRWPVAVVVGAVLTLVAFAVVTSDPPAPRHPDNVQAIATSSPSTHAADTEPSVPERPARPISPADSIHCHGVDPEACTTIAAASARLLGMSGAPLRSVAAWPSLLCNSELDCPPSRLVGTRPLGSAIANLGNGSRAWVNVVDPFPGRPTGEPSRAVAWVVRWQPAP